MTTTEAQDRELFDRIASDYSRKDVTPSSRIARRDMLLRAVAPALARHGGSLGTVVELGCGVAASAVYLNGRFKEYVGIDHAPEMIEAARCFTASVPHVSLIAANAKATDLPANSADTVLMMGVLHHVIDHDALMSEVLRIAKPGAAFICVEPHRGNPIIQGLRKIRAKVDSHYSDQQHFFARRELSDLLSRYDIGDLKLHYFTLLSQPFAQVILNPQFCTVPLSHLACALDPFLERLLVGELGRLTWQIAVTGTLGFGKGPKEALQR